MKGYRGGSYGFKQLRKDKKRVSGPGIWAGNLSFNRFFSGCFGMHDRFSFFYWETFFYSRVLLVAALPSAATAPVIYRWARSNNDTTYWSYTFLLAMIPAFFSAIVALVYLSEATSALELVLLGDAEEKNMDFYGVDSLGSQKQELSIIGLMESVEQLSMGALASVCFFWLFVAFLGAGNYARSMLEYGFSVIVFVLLTGGYFWRFEHRYGSAGLVYGLAGFPYMILAAVTLREVIGRLSGRFGAQVGKVIEDRNIVTLAGFLKLSSVVCIGITLCQVGSASLGRDSLFLYESGERPSDKVLQSYVGLHNLMTYASNFNGMILAILTAFWVFMVFKKRNKEKRNKKFIVDIFPVTLASSTLLVLDMLIQAELANFMHRFGIDHII